jgi:hypothetical protein
VNDTMCVQEVYTTQDLMHHLLQFIKYTGYVLGKAAVIVTKWAIKQYTHNKSGLIIAFSR